MNDVHQITHQCKFYFDQTIQILSGFGFCKRQENGLPACDGM
jgi:hypothetical protein